MGKEQSPHIIEEQSQILFEHFMENGDTIEGALKTMEIFFENVLITVREKNKGW